HFMPDSSRRLSRGGLLERLRRPGQKAAEALAGHPPPRPLDRASQGAQPGLFGLEIPLHGSRDRGIDRRLWIVDQEMAQKPDPDIRVVKLAGVILHRSQRLDGLRGAAAQRLAEKLQQVPEPLALDPKSMEGLDGRPPQ